MRDTAYVGKASWARANHTSSAFYVTVTTNEFLGRTIVWRR